MTLIPEPVRPATPSNLDMLGITFRFCSDTAAYLFEDGQLWKSACWLHKFDDGRLTVAVRRGLTDDDMRVVYGLAEKYWHLDAPKDWKRRRPSKARPVGSRRSHFYVGVNPADPLVSMVIAAEHLNDRVRADERTLESEVTR